MPIKNKAEAIQAYIEAGFILHPLKGKIPTKKEWQKLKFDIHTENDFPDNYGVVLQSHQVVIDMDPRNFRSGDLPWRRLLQELNLDIEIHRRTFWVKTGGGGTHIYFSIPSDVEIMKHVPGFKGLEFLSKGSYVVGPYSMHPETNAFYEIGGGSPKLIAQLPDPLLDLIRRGGVNPYQELAANSILEEKTMIEDESEQAFSRYVDFLKTCSPAVQGEHGDEQTFKAAIRGHDIGLSMTKTLECMAEFFNPRCIPPWELGQLRQKVRNAYRYAKTPQGTDSPKAVFSELKGQSPAYEIKRTSQGEIKRTLANVEQFFLHAKSPLAESVIYDDFLEQPVIVKKMPWDREPCPPKGRQWTDTDTILCKGFLSCLPVYGTDFSVNLIYEAMIHTSHRQRRHPIKEYLESLKWDRIPRLEEWLIHYCSAKDTPYVRAVGSKALMAAVARIYQPGIKFDHMLILEGKQGIGKSQVVASLGGEWYGDLTITPHEKDTIAAMRSKWIIEVSEMEYNNRTDAAAIKSFMTREFDVIRLPYERIPRSLARQSILIGTINPEGDNGYLKDPTGNRRFWPVLTHKISVSDLETDRNQLFAEAKERWQSGELLWLDKKEIETDAFREQTDRTTVDPWTEDIVEWLNCNEHGRTVIAATGGEIFKHALKGETRWFRRSEAVRIANIMRKLNFIHKIFWDATAKKTKNGYVRPEYAADEEVETEMEIVK